MHDELLRLAVRRGSVWSAVAAVVAPLGLAVAVAILAAPIAGVVVEVVGAVVAWLALRRGYSAGLAALRSGLRPAELRVTELAAGIAAATGRPPAATWQVDHDAPNVAVFAGTGGPVLVVTDGAVAALSRDELEAICAAQLAVAGDDGASRLITASGVLAGVRNGGVIALPVVAVLGWILGPAVFVLAGVVAPIILSGWLVGARVRFWAHVAADAVCVGTTRHPGPLATALITLARHNGAQVPVRAIASALGGTEAAWAVPLGPRWTTTTKVNGRVTSRKTAELVGDTALLVRAALVRRVCLDGEEADLVSYGDVQAAVRRAGRAAATGGAAEVEGVLVGEHGVVGVAPPPAGGAPPGWYPDPWGQAQSRWWDGNAWTPAVGPVTTAGGSPTSP